MVTDATCLERNLNLVLQIQKLPTRLLSVNLIDEAERKKIRIDFAELSRAGVPVIPEARRKKGLNELMDAVYAVTNGKIRLNPIKITYDKAIEQAVEIIQPEVRKLTGGRINNRWVALKLLDGDEHIIGSISRHTGIDLAGNANLAALLGKAKQYLAENGIKPEDFRDKTVSRLVTVAEELSRETVTFENRQYNSIDRKIDRVLTSKIFGLPVMLALLAMILWLTVEGANLPSSILADFLFGIEKKISEIILSSGSPAWLHDILVHGMYRTLAWVVSVMLPPMAIFFPLFTFLEDLGYLPRVAFNLDNFFKKACAHGKQALTMCMGFGCNAAGVIGCRIIESPRERLIAILTNNFVPCNAGSRH